MRQWAFEQPVCPNPAGGSPGGPEQRSINSGTRRLTFDKSGKIGSEGAVPDDHPGDRKAIFIAV